MAYIAPTTWTSGGMNWDKPDASNPIYMDAIWRAYTERAIVAGMYGHQIWSKSTDTPGNQSGMYEYRPFQYGWAQDLARKILALSSSFYVVNTDAGTKVATPYLTVLSQIQTDTELVNFSVSEGELLNSAKSAAFLKAAKHFLDLMTIVKESSDWPTLITGSSWSANSASFPIDYDPDDAGSWAQFLADCITYKTETATDYTTQIDSYIRAGSTNLGFTAPISLLYQQNKPLAHNFLMQVYTETSDPPSYYVRPWDWLGLNVYHGDILSTAIPAASETVAIGGDTPIAPANPLNYPYDPANPGGPMYNNTRYLMRFRNFAYDFGVEGGFSFRE